jgi:protein-tyrosine sulfotransferase
MTLPSDSCRGIVVLGAPRSGTTLLRRLLAAHPHIACPPETHVLNACARFIASDPIGEGLDIGVLSGLSYAGLEEGVVLQRVRELAFGLLGEHARLEGKPRWAEKTAIDAFYIRQIDRIFGDHCRFVCVLRHGLDVAVSMQELCDRSGGYMRELHEYIKRYPKPLEAFSRAWSDISMELKSFAARHPENAIVVRYEELVADTAGTMNEIMRHIGEVWQPEWMEQALRSTGQLGFADWKTYGRSRIDSESIGRWKTLPPTTVSALAAIANETLAACGYDRIALTAAPSGEEARRRYELGLLLQAAREQGQSKT